jgi:hypothetical protein
VYFDNYCTSFSSYPDFLQSVLSTPESVDYCSSVGLCSYYDYKGLESLSFRWCFPLFALKYLNKTNRLDYTIKEKYLESTPYILSYCFSSGYYLYVSDFSGEWIISPSPCEYPLPPE